MTLTKEFLDNEITAACAALENAKRQVYQIEGSLSVLRQIRSLLDANELTTDGK